MSLQVQTRAHAVYERVLRTVLTQEKCEHQAQL